MKRDRLERVHLSREDLIAVGFLRENEDLVYVTIVGANGGLRLEIETRPVVFASSHGEGNENERDQMKDGGRGAQVRA